MSDTWNPAQYEKFKEDRTRPFEDLLSLVDRIEGGRAVDLGCGTGELTRLLHERVGAYETVGIDSSDSMLGESTKFAGQGLSFRKGDIRDFNEHATYDLVFANASLQWVEDHEALLPRLRRMLRPGGQLAVQIPANFDHASHTLAAETAASAEFRSALSPGKELSPKSVFRPERYAEMLFAMGFQRQHVRLQVYPVILPSSGDVVEWVKGSCLTAYQKRFTPEAWPKFLARYRENLVAQLGDTRPYFYAFKRILFWGRLA